LEKRLKIAIIGAGGVGGYYGGLLSKAGMDVHLLARGEHLRMIKKRGLIIRSYKGNFRTKVEASDNPDHIGVSDLVLFCVKSFDTEKTAKQITRIVGPETSIISLQNGVGNEEIIGDILGHEKVMGGIAFIGSRIAEPGVILHTAAGSLSFGELDGEMSNRGKLINEIFKSAGIEANLSKNIKKSMWRKMVWNCGFNAITALTGCCVSETLELPETRKVIETAMEEVVKVAHSLGISLDEDLVGKTISSTERQGEIRTSMLVDMEKGKRMEIESINGAVSKMGEKSGIPTPVNDTLYGAVKAVNKRRGH